jgi:DNA-binding transcriptional LysR family regulator
MIDLTRLRLLRELAHRGTMTAVAAAFGLTSSAVSQQLATLERETRTALTERVGRRVLLTAEGRRLVAHAETILEAVEAAELDLAAVGNAPRGVIEIGSFPSLRRRSCSPPLSEPANAFRSSASSSTSSSRRMRSRRCETAAAISR